MPVIDLLEVVQVEHEKAEAATRPFAARDLAADSGEEEGPTVEAGERVERRQAQGGVSSEVLLPADCRREICEQEQPCQVDRCYDNLERGWRAAADARGDQVTGRPGG